jgi:biopolymer transport protein ExbB
MESELQAELPILKRFSSLLEMIVGLAPMLGLIGTVTGLITSFGGLNLGDIGSTKTASVSAGIGEALTTTAAGLVVAMIALIAASLFRGFYQRQLAFIQEYGGQLELLYRRLYESGDRPPASRQTVDASTNHHLTPEPLPPTLPEPAV